MTKISKIASAVALIGASLTFASSAQAQMAPIQQIGVDQMGRAICSGPLGAAPCTDIMAWLQRGGMQQPMPFPQMGPAGPMGVPTGIVPRDGQIVAQIAQGCNGEPTCMAAAWGSVEVQRCAQGIGVPGGCFGPNGEIMKVLNRVLPHNWQPTTIINNARNDITNGPGENNDLVGKNGWVCQTLFGGC